MDMFRKVLAAIWGALTSVFGMLKGLVPSFSLAGVWAAICAFVNYVRVSFVGLMSSMAFWAATIPIVLVTLVVGFRLGVHEERNHGANRVSFMIPAADPPSAMMVALDEANARAKAAADSAKGWKDEAKKKQDEIASLTAELGQVKDALKQARADLAKRPPPAPVAKKADAPKASTVSAPWKPFE